MKRNISFRHIDEPSRGGLAQRVDDLAARHVMPHLRHFAPDAVRLHAALEKNPARHLYCTTLRLHLPATTLVARSEQRELAPSLYEAFAELEVEVKRRVERLRHDALWRRSARRERLRRFKDAIARGTGDRSLYAELIADHIPALHRFVERELAYLQARAELEPENPPVDEVVDEVLARALAQVNERPPRLALRQWLYQLAIEAATDEVARRRGEPGEVSLTDRAPRAAPAATDDEGLADAWRPDAALRIEDVTPGSGAAPEEAYAGAELRAALAAAMALLPHGWRRLLVLHRLEDLALEQVAPVLGIDGATARAWLDHADAFLRAKLAEQGIVPPATDAPAAYLRPARAPALPQIEQELRALLEEPTTSE